MKQPKTANNPRNWPVIRWIALLLTLALAVLFAYSVLTHITEHWVVWLLGVGIVLGALYVVRGNLPAWILQPSQNHLASGGGSGITADNDPRNISPKIYLPILLLAIAAALIATYLVLGNPFTGRP